MLLFILDRKSNAKTGKTNKSGGLVVGALPGIFIIIWFLGCGKLAVFNLGIV